MLCRNRGIFLLLVTILAPSQGIEIRCVFKNRDFSTVGIIYTCDGFELSFKNIPYLLESVEGTHLSGKSNLDVEGLYVGADATGCPHLPWNLEKHFPNLKAIRWWSQNVKSITACDLRLFPKLEFLSLWSNKIESLEKNLFRYTPEISFIQFGNNQVMKVGKDLLENLNHLTYAGFSNNPCINTNATTPQQIQDLKQQLLVQCSRDYFM